MVILYHTNITKSNIYITVSGASENSWSPMEHYFPITPKEGAGRSNRLGDANKLGAYSDEL